MKHWLVIFILTDSGWIAGDKMPNPGWSPRAYDSLEICQKRRDFAAKLVKDIGRVETKHFCSQNKNATLEELEKAAQ